jgi:hypothetical protein
MPPLHHCDPARTPGPFRAPMKNSIAATLFALPFAAQASDLLDLSIRLGPSYPMDGDTRDLAGGIGYNAGVRYGLPIPGIFSALVGSTSGVDLEGFQAKDDTNKLNYIGLSYLEQVRFASMGPVTPYLGFGVGAYRLGINNEHTTSRTIDLGSSQFVTIRSTSGGNDHAIRCGGRAMVGAELPLGLFVELSVVVVGKIDHVNANTANLAVGIRF